VSLQQARHKFLEVTLFPDAEAKKLDKQHSTDEE